MEEGLDRLAQASMRRVPGEFKLLMESRRGVGGVYGFWRSLKARFRGEQFDPKHGKL